MLKYSVLGLLGLVVALVVYVRLAPSEASVWHAPDLPALAPGEHSAKTSHTVQLTVTQSAQTFADLDAIIRATPRTQVLAGSVEAGKITYITRSRLMGFPDYTTVALTSPDGLQIYGRLRFGQADLGVNRARITEWLARLEQEAPVQ